MAQTYDYIGTELKFAVDITADGFSMEDDDYEIVVSSGNRQQVITKGEVLIDEHGQRYISIDTTNFKKGGLYATTYAFIPDDDFPDGKRTEVDVQLLTTLRKLKDGMR